MAEQDYATVSGTKVHKSDFAYAPAGSEPSEWKLPIHDASHVRNALARFNQTQLPAGAKAAALAKIHAAAKKFGIKVGASEARIAVLLTGAGAAVETPAGMELERPGAQLREIAVAVPGTWTKGDHSFSITSEDLSDMVRNFEKRKNDMIVIDYEHASEQPEVARGGPVPGAGWIHKIAVSDQRSALSKLNAESCVLTALVEWTPQAEEMLRTGQYRFFSPAIDWGAKDKETGEPQGATLTSGALTNHPFLEELPPIMLSDGTVITSCSGGLRPPNAAGAHRAPLQKGAMKMAEEKTKLEDPEEKLDEGDGDGEGSGTMADHELPMLKIRKGRAGSKHEGHHILSAGGKDLGCMSDSVFQAHAKTHLGVNPDAEREQASEVGAHGHAPLHETEEQRRALILSEVAKDGKVNAKRATELADRGKITFADYIRATEAEKIIDAAIREGKILPRDRKFFFRDALERPAEFAEYVKNAPQAVRLGVQGLGHAEALPVDQEIDLGVKKLRQGNPKLGYADAYKQFLSENPILAEQYRAKHSSRVNADGTANN